MIFTRPLKLWLLAAVIPTSSAFMQPSLVKKPYSLGMAASSNKQPNDVDISDVLAQVDGALATANDSLPSENIAYDIQYEQYVKAMQQQQYNDAPLHGEKHASAAFADMGAAAFENVRKTAHGTVSFALDTLEKEKDLSKLPEKMVKNIQHDFEHRMKEGISELEYIKANPSVVLTKAKHALESDDVKAAPGRACTAISDFVNSQEVKKAQQLAAQKLKEGLESKEFKAFQDNTKEGLIKAGQMASKAVKDGMNSKEAKAIQKRAKKDTDLLAQSLIKKVNSHPVLRAMLANTKTFMASFKKILRSAFSVFSKQVSVLVGAVKEQQQKLASRSQ